MNTAVKTKAPAVKRDYKELWIGLVNFALAGASIFLFEFWFRTVSQLGWSHMLLNFTIIFLTIATLFVGKTYYGKGTANNLKRGFFTVGLAAITLGTLAILISFSGEIVYPVTGIILALIAFYMLALSMSTVTLIGVVGIGMVLGAGIIYAKMESMIGWPMVGELSKWSLFIILFIGGVWPHFRKFAHGVTGVNKDGGGFGNSDYAGDEGDGDGDTGDE